MTSTNDGKDVNSKQSSGPKGKLYFIELYKFLDGQLSGEVGLQERTQHLCQAWQCIHSLCLQSSPKLHLHLLGWLQTHTARTILQTEWQKPETRPQHSKLVEAIEGHIKESKAAIEARNGSGLVWENHLLKRADWFKSVLANPWGHPILKSLSNPTEEKPSDKEVIQWLKEERSEMFVTRLRQLAMSKACADIAASLITTVMDRARASAAAQDLDKDKLKKNEPTFADTLSREAGFNSEVWDFLTDLEFVLLFKGDKSRCIELAKQRSLRSGYKLVERLLSRVEKVPREKKIWKNAKKVAELIAQVTITRCMVVPSCAGVVYDALYRCARSLAALLPAAALPRAANALAAPAATAAHLHTLATAVADKCKDEMKPFVCELYVRAITTGMNELERLKLKTEKATEARSTEQMLSTWFTQLGSLLSKSPRLNYECALTAFSVHPSRGMYDRIVAAPALPPLATSVESSERSPETNPEFGSWASDSRTATNFVKTSETLNIKQIQHNANVLSTAVLTEGEAIGLGADVCQDLAVLLSGPRHKTLSWDINREVLLENCRSYMERTDGGTRALTTELKYLNLDPRSFQHLPFEKDDDDNIYYGIEKGYEHLVEFQEAENEWRNVLSDSETEDAYSSCMYDTDSSPVRRKKKKSKRLDSTDEEIDPVGPLAEDQQYPRKKERLKTKIKLTPKIKDNNEQVKIMSEKKEQKGEKKERKKKDKTATVPEPSMGPLSRLVGMKVARVESFPVKLEKQNGQQIDLNRKLSFNSDGSETNVIFDGLYSMDDICSPEKNKSYQTPLNKTDKSSASDLKYEKLNNKLLSQVDVALHDVQNKANELQVKSVPVPSTDTGPGHTCSKHVPVQDNDHKQSIKLLELKRLKSDINIQPKTVNQLQNTIENIRANKESIKLPYKIPKEEFNEQYPTLNTSSQAHQNTLGSGNVKQDGYTTPATGEGNSAGNSDAMISPHPLEKLYVGRIVFGLAKYTSSLNEQKSKENDTQTHPTSKTGGKNVYKLCAKQNIDKEKRIPQKPILVRNQPSDKPKNTNETRSSYKNFVNELKASINAGAIKDVPEKKSSKTLPLQNKIKIEALMPQCAKSYVHQKVVEAPNTFARLNYMHKNKQSLVRSKPTCSTKQLQDQKSLSEFNEQIFNYKLDKFHYLQRKGDLTISRIGNIVQNKQPVGSVILQKNQKKASSTNSSNFTKEHTCVSNTLQQHEKKIPVKVNTAANEEGLKTTQKVQTQDVTNETAHTSMLMEKDQQDILSLLQQQNKLNARIPVIKSEIKMKHVAQSSPQRKTESKSNQSVVSNDLDLTAADSRSLTECEKKDKCRDKDAMNISVISQSDKKNPSVIKMPTGGSKNINRSSHSLLKSDATCTNKRRDVKSEESKMPVKRERNYQKKILLDTKSKSDWKVVMDDLLKHKTPSRGPNALDIALNKDSFKKHTPHSEIAKGNVTGAKNKDTYLNSTSYVGNVDYHKVLPQKSSSSMAQTPSKTIQPDLTRINRPDVIHVSKTPLPVPVQLPVPVSVPDVPKNVCNVLNNHDPFISGLPNSDYDLLEELMDDDLRQEIGELISDEESTHYTNVPDKKEIPSPVESKGKTTIVTSYPKSFYYNQRPVRTQEIDTDCRTIVQNNSFITTNIAGNANSVEFIKSSVTSPAFGSANKPYSNTIIAPNINMPRPGNMGHNIEFSGKEAYNTIPSNILPGVENKSSITSHTPCSNKDVYLQRQNNVESRNVLFNTVPQRTAMQNVVIPSEIVYDTYPAMQTQENLNRDLRNFNPNSYITVNSMPNISFLPTTFAAPLVTPVVFDKTKSEIQNDTYHTVVTSTAYSGLNLNSFNQSNQCIKQETTNDNKNTYKDVQNCSDVNVKNNKDLISDRERKRIQQAQESNIYVNNDHKLLEKPKPVYRNYTNVLSSNQSERLTQRRMSIMNRKVSHYINIPPIPLPDIPLHKPESKRTIIDLNKDIKNSVCNVQSHSASNENNVPGENLSRIACSKNKPLEKCKMNKGITNVLESEEPINHAESNNSENLGRNCLIKKYSQAPVDKDEKVVLKEKPEMHKKSKVNIPNETCTENDKLLKTNMTNSLIKPQKISEDIANLNKGNVRDNSVEKIETPKLEHNTGIKDNSEANGNVFEHSDEAVGPLTNMSLIDSQSFNIEDELICSQITKSKLNVTTIEINDEKENDLNKSQKVLDEKLEANNFKSDSEVKETNFKSNISEQKSKTNNDGTVTYNGKSISGLLCKKKNISTRLKDGNKGNTLERVTIKTMISKNKLNNNLPMPNNDVLRKDCNIIKVLPSDKNSTKKRKEQTMYTNTTEVIDLDQVPETTSNLFPANNIDVLENCKFKKQSASKKRFTNRKRDRKNCNVIKDLDKVIFKEITLGKTKNTAKKNFLVTLPNGTKFEVSISGGKNCNVNNLIIDSGMKQLLLNNYLNNKMTSHNTIYQIRINGSVITRKTLESTKQVETIDLISDEEHDSGLTLQTDFGTFRIVSLDKETLTKHRKRLSSKCSVLLTRYSTKQLIALNRKKTVMESKDVEESYESLPLSGNQCLYTLDKEFKQSIEIPLQFSDKRHPEVIHLMTNCVDGNAVKEIPVDLVTEKTTTNTESCIINEIGNVAPNTFKIPDERVNDIAVNTGDEQLNEIGAHGTIATSQQKANNFECCLKIAKCDDLVKKYDIMRAYKQKCYVKLIRCDSMVDKIIKKNQAPSDVDTFSNKIESNNDDDVKNTNLDDVGDSDIIDVFMQPIDEEIYNTNLKRSTSFSILNDFLLCKEIIDFTLEEPFIKNDVNNTNDEQKMYSQIPVQYRCYAEWSMTKRELFLQTIKSLEYTQQEPDVFDTDSRNYADDSTDFESDTETENIISVSETLPKLQVESLIKLTLKFFENQSLYDLLFPVSHDTAETTKKSAYFLKRKIISNDNLTSNKISKLEQTKPSYVEIVSNEESERKPRVSIDDNLVISTPLKVDTNTNSELSYDKNTNDKSINKNKIDTNVDHEQSKSESIFNEIRSTPVNMRDHLNIEINEKKTEDKEINVCVNDVTKTLNTVQVVNDTGGLNMIKSKDVFDTSQIIEISEKKDIPTMQNNDSNFDQSQDKFTYIATDHNYATTIKCETHDLKHINSTEPIHNTMKNDNSESTNQESDVTNTKTEKSLTSENNIITETVQDSLVLGNIENSDVTDYRIADDTYDVLRNVTLIYQDNSEVVLKGIEYEDPVAGTCYMFPLDGTTIFPDVVIEENNCGKEKEKDDTSSDDNRMQIKSKSNENDVDILNNEHISLITPIKTYSRYNKEDKQYCLDKLGDRGIKRKNYSDYKFSVKRYRKSKNIDNRKTRRIMRKSTAYVTEYNRLFDYYSSLKFSYSRPFHNEDIDVSSLLVDWPIKETRVPSPVTELCDIFDDNSKNTCFPDPSKQTLAEELSSECTEYSINSDDTSETNFSMGFGEESDRVKQNLEKKDNISKFSAATLSDVKQSQPFLLSKQYEDYENSIEISNSLNENQKHYNDFIQLKDKVRSYFKKTSIELKYNWMRDNIKDKDMTWNFNGEYDLTNYTLDFCLHHFIEPPPLETIVQVVQIGQLPVSAAAQNPVSCDPRVTQVSDVSPAQCSEENSPHGDVQSPMKTEYTELTTADLTLPLVAEYNHHDSNKATESQEPAHLQTNEEILQSEFGYCGKIQHREEDYDNEEIKDLSLRNKELQTLEKEDTNHSVYTYDANVENECSQLDTPTTLFDSTNKEKNVSEKTDQIAHAMSAAGITSTVENDTKTHAMINFSDKMHQNNVNTTQSSINNCSNTTSITAAALQQALAHILPPPLNQTTSTESEQSQTTSITPQVLHIVQGKNGEGNQITLVDNVQQSVINTPNAAPVLHIVQNKGSTTNASCNGTSVQHTNSFGAISLVETGLQQSSNQLLHIVNAGNQKDNNANQLLKRVNLLTNVQGSNEHKMLQFVCKSSDGKAIQLNSPHQSGMVLRLQPIEPHSVQDTPSHNEELSPTPTAASNASIQENIATQQEIKSRSVYEENYAKFIQNSSSKQSNLEKATSLPKFNQAFGKPVFQDENHKESEINSNDSHLSPMSAADDNPEASDNGMNLDQMGQISSPPLLIRKSPQTSQAQPNLVQQMKQSVTPMNIQTMHGGVIYTRQIPVNIGGGQTINLITVPTTELIDDPNQKQPDIKFVNQGDIVEPSIIKIVPQTAPTSDLTPDETNHSAGATNENGQNTHTQPVLTQMRIKLPMLSKTPQMVSGTRVVRPSFFQIQRNVIGGANQPVYQQLVLTTAPPLGQQTVRLPPAQRNRHIKTPIETQSSPESQLSSSTLEQLREFDMVLEQVKERSTVQPNSTANTSLSKPHTTTMPNDATDDVSAGPTPPEPTQVLYSIGANQHFNVAYVNRKSTVTTTTPTTSTFVRSPDSSGISESPTSSNHVQVSQTVTTATATATATPNSTSVQQNNPKPVKVSSRSRPRPKASSNPPNTLKLNNIPPKPSTQKPLEDEQTTQRILYILAEYREQVENCPDKNKPAPRRRTNPPSNPGSSKRKKSSSGSRRSGGCDTSPIHGDDANRTMGSEDSSCGTSQGDCNENCLETPSPQGSPRKVPRKLSFENESPAPQPRPQLQRNVIVADGQTITVARGATGKPATAVLMPANYILPVSMLKGGQQIAIVTNRGPRLLTVSGGEGGTTGALLLQRLIGPAGLKPMLARPGVRHVRLPTAALHNLHTFNLATATTVQPPDSTVSPAPAPAPAPPDLVETRPAASPWTEKESQNVKPERSPSPEGSEPWNVPTPADTHEYTYEETVRTDNLDRTVLEPIPDRYSPDTEAQRIFDKMFDVDSKRSYVVDTQDDSPRCGYDIDTSDCDDKCYHQVVQKRDISSHRQHRLTHVTAAALRHKYAILEHELRLQKSLSEECEDLGVDSPSASELFPEAELLFAGSPAQDHTQDQHPHRPHTPQPIIINQSIPRPDMDDQIATDHLLQRTDLQEDTNSDLAMNLGLDDVGIVTVTENGATITLDHEEFARSHPNTTFHREPTEETEIHPYTISEIKSRQFTSTIFHASRAPATVLMGPQTTVISQASHDSPHIQHNIRYTHMDNVINAPVVQHSNLNLPSVLVKDDGLTRYDSILTDSRELHLSNTASAIVHSVGNATQVIRRVGYDDDKRDPRFLMDEPETLIAGDDAKMVGEDSSREALESMSGDVDYDRSSPERQTELYWESSSVADRRRPMDFSSDSEKCCKSPPYDETNSTDSSGMGTQIRLDSVIKDARGMDRSGSADGSSADDTLPPLRTYPAKRVYHHPMDRDSGRSLSGKTRAGERFSDSLEVRRRASGRGVVKRCCHCCSGSPLPPRSKKPKQRKPAIDYNMH